MAFAEGWLRGSLVGLVAIFVALVVAEVARYAGLPRPATAVLGFWALLAVFSACTPQVDR